ncbi:MAG: competence/damage-inducible protein A [Flavobacteriales bacterium]
MKAAILTIGDELLIGQVIDTNSSWMARQLNFAGIKVEKKLSVGDDASAIRKALVLLLEEVDLLFITGGLGPTKDDITKHTLTNFFGDQLAMHAPSLDNVKRIFKQYGREPNEVNIQQAMQPSKARIFVNVNGTASGMCFEKDGKIAVSMPGVPFEMKAMLAEQVLPFLRQRYSLPDIIHQTICTQGIGESYVAEKIEDIENSLPAYIKLAYLPSVGQLRLRLSGYGEATEKELSLYRDRICERIPDHVFGFGDAVLQEVVGQELGRQGKTLATAESCTGGYIGHLITSVPGSSAYYKGGIISYANELKTHFLGVLHVDLTQYGAVSRQVVEQMARGIMESTGADFAIATSGIAGPGGGSEEKPVGTVWIAIAGKDEMFSKDFKFGDDRERNIQRASLTALNLLRKELLKK